MLNKKIHVIVKYFYPVAAGIETNVMETYSILATKGWDITIHTSQDTLIEKNYLIPEETIRGLKIKRYPYHWYGYRPEIDWNKADIVCLHNFNVSHIFVIFYSLFRKIIGRKKFALTLTPHGGFTPEWRIFSKWVALGKSLFHSTVGVLLINTIIDKVRAVSEWEKDQIIATGVKKEKVVVISNGIEDEAYKNVDDLASEEIKKRVKTFGRYIIQIGRIYMIKNYEIVIRALPSIPPDVKFVIAGPIGDEKYLKKLKDLIRSLCLENRVIFLGVIRGIDKYYFIKHATMMVHMALWESFCNVVHEGMSQGLICVVANNTALPYLIKNNINGYLVETKDSVSLAHKVKYILANYSIKRMNDMKMRNREFGLKDSWRSTAEQMKILYEKLVENNINPNVEKLFPLRSLIPK